MANPPAALALPCRSRSRRSAASIPSRPSKHAQVGAEANLAWDRSGGLHNGRVYLAYTDSPAPGNQDTKIFLRYSDDNGKTWSDRVKVSDDTAARAANSSRASP